MVTTKKGYCNGSDMLVCVGDKAVGHSTTHTTNMSSEIKDRAVKPKASKPISAGKSVVGLSISVSVDGLVFYGESETGYKALVAAWKAGKSVKLKCMERENSEKPYIKGDFVVSSLDRTDPAQDDSTYSAKFENDGEPDILDESAITEIPEPDATPA